MLLLLFMSSVWYSSALCAPGMRTSGDACVECDAGTFKNSFDASETCALCPTGFVQPAAGASYCQICGPGTRSASDHTCQPCPVGTANGLFASDACTVCAMGRYQEQTGQTMCKSCSAGQYTEDEQGTYCTNCPSGYAQPDDDATACTACSPGRWQDQQGQVACQDCSAGFASATVGSTTPCSACPLGFAQFFTRATDCLPCLAGTFAATVGHELCDLCPAGQISGEQQSHCQACPDGSVQPESGQGVCQACSAGTTSNALKTACDDCPSHPPCCEGYENIGGTCVICPQGSYRDASMTACAACSADSVPKWNLYENDQTNISRVCERCGTGEFAGLEDCQTCEPGQYEVDRVCVDCPTGMYQPEVGRNDSSFCIQCPAGYASSTPAASCEACQPGMFAMADNSQCLACGTVSTTLLEPFNVTRLQNVTRLENITRQQNVTRVVTVTRQQNETRQRNVTHLINVTRVVSVPCPANVSGPCQENQTTPEPQQTVEHYTVAVTVNDTQEVTTAEWVTQQVNVTVLVNVTGREMVNVTVDTRLVSAGQATGCATSCPPSTIPNGSVCLFCPGGKLTSLDYPTSNDDCVSCADGQYRAYSNTNECASCPLGSLPNAEKTECVDCPEGTTFLSGGCSTCPAGYIREHAGSPVPPTPCRPCAPGSVQPLTGQGACPVCLAGTYQAESNATVCDTCAAGFFSGEAANACSACPNGYGQSDPGQAACTLCTAAQDTFEGQCRLCPPGKQMPFQDTSARDDAEALVQSRQEALRAAPANASSSVIAVLQEAAADANRTLELVTLTLRLEKPTCTDCPAGHANPATDGVCQACASGLYAADTTQCATCPPGFVPNLQGAGSSFCKDCTNITGPCQECAGGHFFQVSTRSCETCPSGYVNTGQMQDCETCPGVKVPHDGRVCEYCPSGFTRSGLANCSACLPGQYGNERGACVDCPIGWYSVETAAATCVQCGALETSVVSDLTSCVACPTSATVVVSGLCANCPPGRQADSGHVACTSCAAGRYRFVGEASCADCQVGMYRSEDMEAPCQLCPSGFFNQLAGQTFCSDCAADSDNANCDECAAGKYAMGSTCVHCPAGYVSVFGQESCQECAPGTYQDQISGTVCKSCDAGRYQINTAALGCVACGTGQFQAEQQQAACHLCPRGTFSAVTGKVQCDACSRGTSTTAEGAVSSSQCEACPAGRAEVAGVCVLCDEGTYQPAAGAVECTECTPAGSLSPRGSLNAAACFEVRGMKSYVFGMKSDSKRVRTASLACEIRHNLQLMCPSCSCDDDTRNGFWAGPVCNECRRGFAGRSCLIGCAGYDGENDNTICHGKGKCWFGKFGNGLCYCGGHAVLDASSKNIVVDVRTCPKGKICPGYGDTVMEQTTYIPIYYIMQYRQYSTFVLQLSQQTPLRGHMWFQRYPPNKAYENTCQHCVGPYDGKPMTSTGYWSSAGVFTPFLAGIQTENGFHGENCQYECGLCLNGGRCSHVAHSRRYHYTLEDTYVKQVTVKLPVTTCICSSIVYDPQHMCCPNGFQPYIFYGRRGTTPYSRFTRAPYITSMLNRREEYWIDKDMYVETDNDGQPYATPYVEPADGRIAVANNNRQYSDEDAPVVKVSFQEFGPYNKHVFYGVPRDMCRACPGLFGKGVRSISYGIDTATQAEEFWWDNAMGAAARKCNGVGVCDFYAADRQQDVRFMGDVHEYRRVKRGYTCAGAAVESLFVSSKAECATTPYFAYVEAYQGGTLSDLNSGSLIAVTSSLAIQLAHDYNSSWYALFDDGTTRFWTLPLFSMNGNTAAGPTPSSDSYVRLYPVTTNCRRYTSCESFEYAPGFTVYENVKGEGDDRLATATFDRMDTCFTFSTEPGGVARVSTFGLFQTNTYSNGQDPFLGGLCPKGHFCTSHNGIGYKEACPAGYYQPLEGVTRTNAEHDCAQLTSNTGQATAACALRVTTANTNDYVDRVCLRCAPNHYAPEGSAACSACPTGRVKKFSGNADTLSMKNFPTALTKHNVWYYRQDENGNMNEDCAMVPEGHVHIASANHMMDYKLSFLPVLACPYGFTTRPSSFIPEGQTRTDLTRYLEHSVYINETDLQPVQINLTLAPYVTLAPQFLDTLPVSERDAAKETFSAFVRENCNVCPGISVTGRESGLCSTCFANRLKKWAKEALVKVAQQHGQLVELEMTKTPDSGSRNRTVPCLRGASQCIAYDATTLQNVALEARLDQVYTSTIIMTTTDPTQAVSLSDCYLACSSYDSDSTRAIAFNMATPGECHCSTSAMTTAAVGGERLMWYEVVSFGTSWADDALALCTLCSPGKFTEAATDTCTDCAPGRFTSSTTESNRHYCNACEVGYFSVFSSSTECQHCPLGYVQPATGQQACTPCGNFQTAVANAVTVLLDTFQDETGQAVCKTCPLGWKTNDPAWTRSTSCVICPQGWYQTTGVIFSDVPYITGLKCVQCSVGQYTTAPAQTECIACPQGYERSASGVGCSKCPIGKTLGGAQLRCIGCPRGKYQDQEATRFSGATTNWPTTLQGGSRYFQFKSLKDRTLASFTTAETDENNAWRSGPCKVCSSGYYATGGQDGYGHTRCVVCPGGRLCSAIGIGTTCPAGRYLESGEWTTGAGKLTTTSANICKTCIAGKTSQSGKRYCDWCPVGRSTAGNTGQSSCTACNTLTPRRSTSNRWTTWTYDCPIASGYPSDSWCNKYGVYNADDVGQSNPYPPRGRGGVYNMGNQYVRPIQAAPGHVAWGAWKTRGKIAFVSSGISQAYASDSWRLKYNIKMTWNIWLKFKYQRACVITWPYRTAATIPTYSSMSDCKARSSTAYYTYIDNFGSRRTSTIDMNRGYSNVQFMLPTGYKFQIVVEMEMEKVDKFIWKTELDHTKYPPPIVWLLTAVYPDLDQYETVARSTKPSEIRSSSLKITLDIVRSSGNPSDIRLDYYMPSSRIDKWETQTGVAATQMRMAQTVPNTFMCTQTSREILVYTRL